MQKKPKQNKIKQNKNKQKTKLLRELKKEKSYFQNESCIDHIQWCADFILSYVFAQNDHFF